MSRASPEPILRVADLSVSFTAQGRAIHALNGVSFDLYRGETLAIVGESGSGKSTTGLAIMGLVDRVRGTSISGAVHLARKDGTRGNILALDDRALRKVRGNDVAMIFQEPMSSLNPVYTVGAQVIEALRQHQALDARAARSEACDLLAELGIADPAECLARYPHQLSGGMRQRVMIAIALSGDPQILIADEPTTALDVTIQAQILELLRRLQQRSGMSIIFITHNLGVVGEIAERAIVMYAGEVTEQLPVASLFDRRAHALHDGAAPLGAAARRAARAQLAAIPGAPPSMSALPFRLRVPSALRAPDAGLRGRASAARHRGARSRGALPPLARACRGGRMNAPPLLEVRDLRKWYAIRGGIIPRVRGHVRAVDGVSFAVRPGEVLGIAGESGSGKSTIGRCVLRLIEPTAGDDQLRGQRRHAARPPRAAAVPAQRADDLPGPLRLARPVDEHRRDRRRAARRAGHGGRRA